MAEHHPLGSIEYLRENLLKNYKPGFPVLKELVQNAEDAGSTHFDFGWIEGISNAKHPLLRTPALFIVDDGTFTNENARSIRYIIGGSNKPKDQDAIGKFGLGLKSVFHLCEAFFYIGSEIQNPRSKRADIFNPWADRDGDLYHPEWGEFDPEDCKKVKDALNKIIEQPEYQSQWFILWIPLRHISHQTHELEEEGIQLGYIKNGKADFFNKEIPSFLSEEATKLEFTLLLPLLHSLKTIRYWENDLDCGQEKYLITINSGERRHAALSKLNPSEAHALKGTVNLTSRSSCIDVEFSGQEIIHVIHENYTFTDIRERDNFPTKFKNIQPHTAVIFGRWQSSQPANLMIRTAVFLPIASSSSNISSQNSFCLTLHGYFFVDFARTGILGWNNERHIIAIQRFEGDDDDTVLKKEWNFHLYKSLLGTILDALKDFSQGLNNDEIEIFCKALHAKPLFRENSQEICEKKQWIYRINPQEERWQLIDSGQVHLRILPKIPPNWASFPHLKKLPEQYYLTVEGKPNLLARKNTLTWKSEEICDILDSLKPSEIFSNIDNLSFLQAFLSQQETKVINDEKVQVSLRELLHKAFRELLHKAFAKLGIAELQKDKILPFVKKLVELLLPKNRYAIAKFAVNEPTSVKFDANEQTAVHNVLNKLYALNLDVLLIYEIFEPASQSSQAILKSEQAVDVLTCLSDILKEDKSIYLAICNLIKQILSKFDSPLIIIGELADKILFYGYKYREKKTYLWSYAKLCESRSKNLLFTGKYNTIAAALNEAIPDYDFIFIEEDLASILNKIPSMKGISSLTLDSCKNLLDKKPILAIPEQRINLLKELIRHV
ncbi:sacsin N-terminal ATP-binding-like domain-containing protein [Microcoleus sp. B7-D4]|uniref:sacsin N-terminal ATP-binding-like domain-containing protein n=1 Tax=Microcoleus sp. B7-D4 TaxID=2818696 RepID=UPI002FD6E726